MLASIQVPRIGKHCIISFAPLTNEISRLMSGVEMVGRGHGIGLEEGIERVRIWKTRIGKEIGNWVEECIGGDIL